MGEQLIIVKKIKFQKKLSLNKETVAKLNEEQMEQANGGWGGRQTYDVLDAWTTPSIIRCPQSDQCHGGGRWTDFFCWTQRGC